MAVSISLDEAVIFDRAFGAGFWGLFCFSIGVMATGVVANLSGSTQSPVLITATTCGLVGAVIGAMFPPRVIPIEVTRSCRSAERSDGECPLCGRGYPAGAAACTGCGEPIGESGLSSQL